jgi:hypothetical protein
MSIHYYLSVFPMEALIASQLDPAHFGSYMATGSKKGSQERVIFIEVEGGFSENFDWKYAEEKCVPYPDGDPKHSVYLGVYRILERVPLDALGTMYLTTRDGRSIGIEKSDYEWKANANTVYYVYQELCPLSPVIVSSLAAKEFGAYLNNPESKVFVPTILYADLKVIDLNDRVHTGNIGSLYDGKIPHLTQCISEITGPDMKTSKTLTRTNVESFHFQTINYGLYVSSSAGICMYKMPTLDEIKEINYDWGRSANII